MVRLRVIEQPGPDSVYPEVIIAHDLTFYVEYDRKTLADWLEEIKYLIILYQIIL